MQDQAEAAAAVGVAQSRISQIENGDLEAMEPETLHAYAAALGGRIDVTISAGPRSVKIDVAISVGPRSVKVA